MFKRSTQENIQNHVSNLQQISVFCRKLIIVLSKIKTPFALNPSVKTFHLHQKCLISWFSFIRCPLPLNFIPKLLLSLPGIAAVGCFYIDVAAPSSWTLRGPVAKILQYLLLQEEQFIYGIFYQQNWKFLRKGTFSRSILKHGLEIM